MISLPTRAIRSPAPAVAGLLLALLARGAPAAAPAPDPAPQKVAPELREIWIPTNEFERALSRHPRTILLNADQYRRLLDESRPSDPRREPPHPLVHTRTVIDVSPSDTGALVQTTCTVHPLVDRWARIPIRLPTDIVGETRVVGEIALHRPSDGRGLELFARGPDPCEIGFASLATVTREAGISQLQLANPGTAQTIVRLHLPPRTTVRCEFPTRVLPSADGTLAEITPPPRAPACQVTWQPATAIPADARAILQHSAFLYAIDEEKVRADLAIVLDATIGDLPDRVTIRAPAKAAILRVEGNDVASWNLQGETISIEFTRARRQHAAFRLLAETPALGAAPACDVTLPVAAVNEAYRVTGKFAVAGSPGVDLREIVAPPPAVRDDRAYGPDIVAGIPHFAAAFAFPSLPQPPSVSVARSAQKFRVTCETTVDLSLEMIRLQRDLLLDVDHRDLFELAATLPPDEELLEVRPADATRIDWREENRAIRIRFLDGLNAPSQTRLSLLSRRAPSPWPPTTATPVPLNIRPLAIAEAARLPGTIALRADPSLQIQTTKINGLDPRDARSGPVRADLAWSHRDSFALDTLVSRRAPETVARLLGYLLPTASALEIRAQIDLETRFAGIRTLQLHTAAKTAPLFDFTGPDIAEKHLDGDTWTIRFQKEIRGAYALRAHAVIPLPFDKERRFRVEVPELAPADVRRATGTWVVEANTDTEITFEPRAMTAGDLLHPPALAQYTPQHRVVAVFDYLAHPAGLSLSGTRHQPAPLATTIVDSITLDSVLSPNGADRHLARIELRSAGDQFLDLQLPHPSSLWSLAVDGTPTKPVASRPDTVRITLPAHIDPSRTITALVLYETPAENWRHGGTTTLPAPRCDPALPVLRSSWTLHLPPEFVYRDFRSQLRPTFKIADPLLVPWIARTLPRALAPLALLDRRISRMATFQDASPSPRAAPGTGERREMLGAALDLTAPPAAPPTVSTSALKSASKGERAREAPATDAFQRKDQAAATAAGERVQTAAALGQENLIPLTLDLPRVGIPLRFDGTCAPDQISFVHLARARLARGAWCWIALGAIGFAMLGRRRPWFALAWGMLLLTFLPPCTWPALARICNALLLGWLSGFTIDRFAAWFIRSRTQSEEAAS